MRSVEPSAAKVAGACLADWPEEKTGMISQPGKGSGNIGVRQARAEAMTESLGSQNLLSRPLTWVWSMPTRRQNFWNATNDMPIAGERPYMPQPLRWPWMMSREWARRTFMAGSPMEFMLTMAQLP